MILLRYLWALPTTFVGILLILPTLLTGGKLHCHTGVLELQGGFVRFLLTHLVTLPNGASAMTLGHVVIGRDQECLDRTRSHERIHVQQVERWGMFFIPAYLCCSLWLRLRGYDGYLDNPFEVEAYAKAPCGERPLKNEE